VKRPAAAELSPSNDGAVTEELDAPVDVVERFEDGYASPYSVKPIGTPTANDLVVAAVPL